MGEGRPSAVRGQTEVGSYFVANYPPFSVWTKEAVGENARRVLASSPQPGVPLGLYLHIPFCRKRCHFCYFRVYTDKNARDVAHYVDTLVREWELYQAQPATAGRPLDFVYFGGGTPSFLAIPQLEGLVGRLGALTPWASTEEVAFECEPGTLTGGKLEAIRGMGVTPSASASRTSTTGSSGRTAAPIAPPRSSRPTTRRARWGSPRSTST